MTEAPQEPATPSRTGETAVPETTTACEPRTAPRPDVPPDSLALATQVAAWHALPGMVASEPSTEQVLATLDAEMARLEQSVTRSGWTSWAGTAALGGIAWVFITLLDASTAFPWHTFLVVTTLLSFLQDFIYGVDDALRPRRGLGLLIGDQARILFAKETLRFARKQYLFSVTRSLLLASASYILLPTLVGWIWWVPFIGYTLLCLSATIFLVLSFIDRPIPKQEKFYLGELVGQTIVLYVAITAVYVLADSWHAGDFIALKAALLTIAAAHVLRGLAQPQFELPALDKLRELRRQLGFGQIITLQAITQAEAALFGLPSLLIVAPEFLALNQAHDRFVGKVVQLTEKISILGKHVVDASSLAEVSQNHINIGEALFQHAIATHRPLGPLGARFTEAHDELTERIEHFKQNTKNDSSIPIIEKMRASQNRTFALAVMRMLSELKRLVAHTRALEQLASTHNLPTPPGLQGAVNALEASLACRLAELQTMGSEPKSAPNGPT